MTEIHITPVHLLKLLLPGILVYCLKLLMRSVVANEV